MLRALILLILLSGLAYWLQGEQERGQFRQVDEGFLDFLLSNTREEFKPDPASMAEKLVFISIREEDKAEYEAWPPLPIDWQMVLKNLPASEPAALVIAEPLHWPVEPKPPFIDQLGESLARMPSLVLAAGVVAEGTGGGEVLAFAKDKLPVVPRAHDDVNLLPAIASLQAKPEEGLLRQGDVGLLMPGQKAIAMRAGEKVVPALELQALSHATRTPFSRVRLHLGPGAGVHLGDDIFVPLSNEGHVLLPAGTAAATELNAVDLVTASVTGEDAEVSKTLGKGKVIVLGLGDAMTRQRAQAIAASLALPRLRALGFIEQIAVWAAAGLLALSLLWWAPGSKAPTRTAVLLILALTASYLAFQNGRLWCPPAIPAALIVAGGLYTWLFGRPKPQPKVDSTATAP